MDEEPCSTAHLVELENGDWYCWNCNRTFDHEMNEEMLANEASV